MPDARTEAIDALEPAEVTPLGRALIQIVTAFTERCSVARDGAAGLTIWDLITGRRTTWGRGRHPDIDEPLESIKALAAQAGLWVLWRNGHAIVVDYAAFEAAATPAPETMALVPCWLIQVMAEHWQGGSAPGDGISSDVFDLIDTALQASVLRSRDAMIAADQDR